MLLKRLTIAVLQGILIITPVFADPPTSQTSLVSPGLSLINQAKLIGSVNPNQIINFTVWIKLRNKEQLDQLVADIYDPNNPKYQQFLTKQDFEQNYAPDQNVEIHLVHYFIDKGMQAQLVNHKIEVTATAEQIEQIFKIQINHYLYQNKTIYANSSAPTMNSSLGNYVAGITGLSTLPRFRPMISKLNPIRNTQQTEALHLVWNSFIPTVIPTTNSLNGFTGSQLQITYNIANIPAIKGQAINGSGQTIVIIDTCSNASPAQIMSDANTYNSANNIALLSASNFAVINPDGTAYSGSSRSCNACSDWSGEIALDVQSAHTLAPEAHIVLVLANSENDLETALTDITSSLYTNKFMLANFPNAYVLSNSWSGVEEQNDPLDASLQSATAMGLSINFASGDCGDNTPSTSGCPNTPSPTVNYPSSSSYVTTIGATSVFVGGDWSYAFETGWGSGTTNGSGSGGGISKYYAPAAWQNSISTFTAGGYPNGDVGSYNKRAIPDIAMLGDDNTGLLIYVNGSYNEIGGTSLATPLFSATLALINQSRSLLGKTPRIGLAAPYLYTHNSQLLGAMAINLIDPPHQIISGATPVPGGPQSAFMINGVIFNWDTSLTLVENQFWNDVVGIGSPSIPNFVSTMANL